MIKFEPTIPIFITLLTLVPLFILCVVMIVKVKPNESDSTKLSWARRLVLVLCLILIALGPAVLSKEKRTSLTNLDILFVVDKTGSMSAEDMPGGKTRLEFVKRDIEYLTHTLPPAKFAAIAFDSHASEQVPLTEDSRAVRSWARALTPEITRYSSGTNISVSLETIYNVVNNIRAQNPDDKIALIFMSDGENNDGRGLAPFEALKDSVYSGAVIGYGTQSGGKMKEYFPSINSLLAPEKSAGDPSAHQGYIKEKSGEEAVSKLNEETLRQIAKDMGIKYILRENDENITDFAYSIFAKNWHEKPVDQNTYVWNLLVWPFEIIFALLMLWELLIQVLLHSGGSRR
jgi:Ca-activated chloride channel family protein